MELSADVKEAFSSFTSDTSLFALPLQLSDATLCPLPPISYPDDSQNTFQKALNRLDTILSPKHVIFLVVHRNDALIAVTYVPYLASAESKNTLLEGRNKVIQELGQDSFAASIICKEMGEITDARSWDERDGQGQSWDDVNARAEQSIDAPEDSHAEHADVKDEGYKKTKCRLCDRRMKNKINDDALSALSSLSEDGACVQVSVNITTEVLQLNFQATNLLPSQIAAKLPTDRPSFTFYRRQVSHVLYFIFCSPDSASVQERMKHTMAIPGLINIIAKDNGVDVNQKVEIHEPEELEFEETDKRIGMFRSMYLRNGVKGTESTWEGMEEYQKTLDAVR